MESKVGLPFAKKRKLTSIIVSNYWTTMKSR